MERGNEVVQPAAAPATSANVANFSGSAGNVSADVGGVDMGGFNVSVAGGAAGAGAKDKDAKDTGTPADPDAGGAGSGSTGA